VAAPAGTTRPAPKDLIRERLVDDSYRRLAPHGHAHHRRHVLQQVLRVLLGLEKQREQYTGFDNGGFISCRWRHLSRMSASSPFPISLQSNATFLIYEKCCHLGLCLHMIEPNSRGQCPIPCQLQPKIGRVSLWLWRTGPGGQLQRHRLRFQV